MADLSAVPTEELQRALEGISVPSRSSLAVFSNWARTFECRPQRVFAPTTVEQCRQIVELARRENAVVHPVGVGHSPSDLACTNGWLIRMVGVSGLVSTQLEKKTATFLAGTTLHDVHKALASCSPPMALRNIGSISDQTIAGVISTASHGSGIHFPVLSKHVHSLRLILPQTGAPEVLVSETQDPELFSASLCGLGATGLITEVEIEIEEAFRLEEKKEPKTVDYVLQHLDEIKGSAEHVRVWWYPDGKGMIVARANRVYVPAQPTASLVAHVLGFHVTQFFLFVARVVPSLTPAVGRWAWWLSNVESTVVDEGYRVLNFDCLFPQYALEWAIDSSKAVEVLTELRTWLDQEAANAKGLRIHFPIEIRWSSADDIWLSPSYGRETVWIGVVTYRPYGLPVPYRNFQGRFAQICASYGGRPHWAKQHTLKPTEFSQLYPKFNDFRRVIDRVDQVGIMRSEYVRRHIQGDSVADRLFKKRQ